MKKLLLFSTLYFCSSILTAQSNFIHQDSVFAQSADCTAGVNVCIDSISYNNVADYRFFLDGAAFTAPFEACREDTIHTYSYFVIFQDGETGPFALNSWIVDGQTFSIPSFTALPQLLDSMRRWDAAGNWQLEPSSQIIYGFPSRGRTYSCQSITGLGRGGRNDVCYNVGFNFSGLKFRVNPGRHQFVVEQIASGQRDTVKVTAACVSKDTIRQTMFIGTTRSYCVNVSQLLGTQQLTSFSNFCAHTTTKVNFTNVNNYCIDYTGVAVGTDTACLRVCDQYGVCDTTYLFITAEPNTSRFYQFQDTISVGLSRQKCDITLPSGTLNVFENMCPTRSGTMVSFALDVPSHCVTYTGLAVGADTACIRVCNTLRVCDTTQFYITGQTAPLPPRGTVSNVVDTISINDVKTNCALTKPSGTLTTFTNFCPSSSGTNVAFTLDNANKCVTYRGLAVGLNNACLEVCNSLGTCDTTNFFINVKAAPTVTTHVFSDTITNGLSRQKCNLTMPTGTINIFENLCSTRSGTNATFVLNAATRCVTYTGVSAGTDSACVRVCNTLGACDTTLMLIQAIPVVVTPQGGSHTFNDTITVSLNRQKCNLTIPTGTINVFQNICIGKSGTKVTFVLDVATRCVTYTGVSAGTDTACVRVCNTSGVCDTTTMSIQVIPVVINPQGGAHTFNDTISIGLTRQKCNLTMPAGTINVFQNLCTGSSGTNVSFVLDVVTRCVTYIGLANGADRACVRVCNTNGVCDTTTMIIQALPVSRTHSFTDTITVGLTRQKCDIAIPTGTINVFQNICPTKSGTKIGFTLAAATRCVAYRGLTVGFDTACIRVCNTEGVCDTTIFVIEAKPVQIVGGANAHVFNYTISVGLSRSKCDFIAPLGSTTIENLCLAKSGSKVRFDINALTFCVTYSGVSIGRDTACIRICNTSGKCDTTFMYIQARVTTRPVLTLSVDTLKTRIFERKTYCPDSTELAGSPISLIKFCTPAKFDNSTISLDTLKKCVTVTGLSAGIDTFCIALCSTAGFCDTTTLYVKVSPDTLKPTRSIDSIKIKIGELRVYCPDTLELLSGRVTNISSCTTTNFDNSLLMFNNVTKCVESRGTSAGKDTACIILCNSVGLCDTTTLYVTVTADTIKPTPDTVRITIRLGQDSIFRNIDSTQIFGSVDTIYDACPGRNGARARMRLNRINRIVGITGVNIGNDTMCVVVCNKTSRLCDTTTIIVTVRDTQRLTPIQAYNDFDTIRQGKSLVFQVYKNDSLNRLIPTRLVVVRPPLKGKADTISFRQGLIKYTAGRTPQACGLDSFRYRVCVDTVCSEATVVINVICPDSLRAYTGISPNGDGKNDVFFIEGLQKFPSNTLCIFNRWGNEVHKAKDYANDWQGTWNGKDLPDGTYFYWLRDDATGNLLMTGYLQILR